MKEILLRALIEKDHFKKMTEVDVVYSGLDIGGMLPSKVTGTFTVIRIMERRNTQTLLMEGVSVKDGERVRFETDDILSIDGMTPERFAENYMIDTEGNDIPVKGARRGRRPNNWTGD